MKKIIAILCGLTLLISQFYGVANKAYADELSTEDKARILNQIDLLAGDGYSFNLDQPLRRCDAAAFLVKAMGQNIVVLQNKANYSKTKFKDVPAAAWYAPYVGYMTQQGIITGNTDGSFTPEAYISEKAFLTMLLKSMGYTTQDFSWNTVNSYAYEIGLVSDISYVFKDDDNTNYKRQDVVNALYNGLFKPMKSGNKNFGQLLVEGKIISSDKAESLGIIRKDRLASLITDIKVVGYSQITATFNEAIEVPSLSQIKIYDKSKPTVILAPQKVEMSGNVLTIDMSPQSDKVEYVLEITGLKDALGNVVSSVQKEFTGYMVAETVNANFEISKIEPINSKTINLYFTHPVSDKSEIELLYDIYLGDTKFVEGNYKTLTLTKSTQNANKVTLSLKELSFEMGKEYNVKIKGDLISSYGVYLNKGAGHSMVFTGATAVPVATTISSVECQEGVYVYFTFSQVVDNESAMKTTNYSIREVETNRYLTISNVYGMKTKDKLNKNFVIKVSDTSIGKNYELIAENIYDSNKNFNLGKMKGTFASNYAITQYLMIESITPIDSTTISAKFTRELSAASINANVSVPGVSVVMKALDAEDPSIMKIYLNASTPLQLGRGYSVSFYSGITDYIDKAPLYNLTGAVLGNGTTKSAMAIESAVFISDSAIMIKFNQPISATQSTQANQYDVYFNDGKSEKMLIPGTVEKVNEQSVVIKLPYLLSSGTYRVQAKNIYDISNQHKTAVVNSDVK